MRYNVENGGNDEIDPPKLKQIIPEISKIFLNDAKQ